MIDRARDNEKIELKTPFVVEEVLGEDSISGLRLRNTETDETEDVDAGALFVAIGHDPNTKLFVDQLDHDANGYLVTKAGHDRDEHPRRLRGRRRAGPHLPPGRDRRRQRLYGRSRRGAVPRGARRATRGTALTAPRPEAEPTKV